MGIESILSDLLTNLGTDIPTFSLLVTSLMSILAMAVSPYLGMLFGFLGTAVLTLIFYNMGYDMELVIIALLTWFVIIVLSVLLSHKKGSVGVV